MWYVPCSKLPCRVPYNVCCIILDLVVHVNLSVCICFEVMLALDCMHKCIYMHTVKSKWSHELKNVLFTHSNHGPPSEQSIV